MYPLQKIKKTYELFSEILKIMYSCGKKRAHYSFAFKQHFYMRMQSCLFHHKIISKLILKYMFFIKTTCVK